MGELLYRAVAESAPGDDPFEYVMSDASIDRYGDQIVSEGWQLANFKKHPVGLFNHSANQVIGRWRDVRVADGQLRGRLEMVGEGLSAMTDYVRGLVTTGFLRAVSVGFRPLKKEPLDPEHPYGAQRFLKSELVECSLVSVPANPNALQVVRAMGIPAETSALIFAAQARALRRSARPAGHGKPAETRPETSLTAGRIHGYFDND